MTQDNFNFDNEQQILKKVVKKLTYNINLNSSEESFFDENIKKVTSSLFKISKSKYLHVFNKLIYQNPAAFILATAQE